MRRYGKPGSGRRKTTKKKPVNKPVVSSKNSVTFNKTSSEKRVSLNAGKTAGPRRTVKTSVTVARMKPKKRKTFYAAAPLKKRKKRQS